MERGIPLVFGEVRLGAQEVMLSKSHEEVLA
jgi:hypothetical protein